MIVTLAWGSRKRHIAVDGEILCHPKFSDSVTQRSADVSYNALATYGIPTQPKTHADSKTLQTGGMIPAIALIEVKIQGSPLILSSICGSCQKRYARKLKEIQKCS